MSLSQARAEPDEPILQTDEYGNPIPQPSTTAMYGGPSREGSSPTAYGYTGAYNSADHGGQRQPKRSPQTWDYDPTHRRGTTVGEYGRSGVGLMDRAKEKLAEVGGFKDDPGHTTGDISEKGLK